MRTHIAAKEAGATPSPLSRGAKATLIAYEAICAAFVIAVVCVLVWLFGLYAFAVIAAWLHVSVWRTKWSSGWVKAFMVSSTAVVLVLGVVGAIAASGNCHVAPSGSGLRCHWEYRLDLQG